MSNGASPGIRTRSRIAPVANGQVNGAPNAPARVGDGDTSWGKTGNAALAAYEAEKVRKAQEQEERDRQMRAPIRFRLKPGEQADVLVLDAELGFSFYEHERFRKDAPRGQKFTYEACPGEWDFCPLDEPGNHGFGPRYFVMMLTILDLRPYTYPEGHQKAGVTIPVTKKLLPVKIEQQGFFHRQFQKYGSLRGLHLLMVRDGKTNSKIGTPEFVDKYDDDILIAEYGHPEEKNQQGQVVRAANELIQPYNYGVVFPKPSGEDLRRRYGGAAPAGSRQDNSSEWGAHDPGQQTANGGGRAGNGGTAPAADQPRPGPRQGIRTRAATQPQPQQDHEDDDTSDPDQIPF